MAGPQLRRAQKSRNRNNGKRIVTRELVKAISTANLEALVAETPKGTSFKGELRRKCLNELARREKAQRNLIVAHSKRGMKKPTTKTDETTNG